MNFLTKRLPVLLFAAVAMLTCAVTVQTGSLEQGLVTGAVAAFAATQVLPAPTGSRGFCYALNPASALKLDKVLRDGARALKRRLSPILALSTVMRDQVLTETKTVRVPFYALETMTSKDFDGSYSFAGVDGSVNSKSVTVNKRKYQVLEFTSEDLARNSVVDLNKVMMMKVEKLAEDVLTDIFSVVTTANFPDALIEIAAASFDRSDVSAFRTELNQAHWPSFGRALLLESAYEGALVTDQLNVQTTGNDRALREGSVGRLVGFDIFDHPGMPENGERLVGAALLPYAICAAFAPIPPAPEVREQLSDYRQIVAEGLTLEYRSHGDPMSDTAHRSIEVNYGYEVGDRAQLQRITRPVA